MSKLLKLRFMRLMCDFMMDWYYFRHMPKEAKERKMAIVNSVREDIMTEIQGENLERGI